MSVCSSCISSFGARSGGANLDAPGLRVEGGEAKSTVVLHDGAAAATLNTIQEGELHVYKIVVRRVPRDGEGGRNGAGGSFDKACDGAAQVNDLVDLQNLLIDQAIAGVTRGRYVGEARDRVQVDDSLLIPYAKRPVFQNVAVCQSRYNDFVDQGAIKMDLSLCP